MVISVSVFLFPASDAFSAILKVPVQYDNIQKAIDRASPGDTVLVAPGKYRGDIRLKEKVVLQGAGAETTIIEGAGAGSVIEGAKEAVVEGFTITGSGRKGSIGVTLDAGISCFNAPMTIANNRIKGNNTGIKLYYSPSNVINNEITGSAFYGIYLIYSDSLIENNVISRNASHGIYNSYSNPEIANNTLTANYTGMFSEVSRVVVRNNIITGNKIAGVNWAEFIGSQYRTEPVLFNNLVWGNGEDYVNVARPASDISKDPKFGAGHRLKAGSPALKAGDGGGEIGAFGGRYAQSKVPLPPSEKSYAKLSLKERIETIKEPDYMTQKDWRDDPLRRGRGDFEGFCVPCHGPQGKGDGLLADTLDVKPRDLSDPSIMSNRTDETIFKVIKEGGGSVGFSDSMMSFSAQFTDDEVRNIIKYIRSEICRCGFAGGN